MIRAAAVLFASLCAGIPAVASEDALTRADVHTAPSERVWFPADDHPAINYGAAALDNAVSRLIGRIAEGKTQLLRDEKKGYLMSLLAELNIPVASQIVVFSKSSLQRRFITPQTPRAIYFADDVAVAYIPGAPLIEIAAQDSKQGVVYFVIAQDHAGAGKVERRNDCLNCHVSRASMAVPGNLVRSLATQATGIPAHQFGNFVVDHRTPFAKRWGGWYVTGLSGAVHMGNIVLAETEQQEGRAPQFKKIERQFEVDSYALPTSNAAPLMVFNHQMHMANLLTRIGWDVRVAQYQYVAQSTTREVEQALLASDAREIADYMLFIDEAPLTGSVEDSGPFAMQFSAKGPKDGQGRSLRELDLKERLMRYRCSYMIYSQVFESLPHEAKTAIYARMWDILSGKDRDAKYATFSARDRRAVIEILRDTKSDLPASFR